MKLIIVILLLPLLAISQNKGDNTIVVKGVGFMQVCSALIDAGYIIDKKDNDLQTVKTELKSGQDKNKWMKLLLNIRVKDSAAIITGQWYNTLGDDPIETNTYKIENTSGNPKSCFKEMKTFALSFKKPVEYLKQ